MTATSHDVARLAGVSQPTVSRALRGDPRVTAETRQRIADAALALNYIPSQMGRSLSTRATHRVAVVADLSNPLYPLIVPSIHDALEARGYRMVLLAERDDDSSGYAALLDHSVDGVLLTTVRRHSPLPFTLQQRKIPMVMLNRTSETIDVDSVVADNRVAGRAATELLLEAGHREIGLLAGPDETSTSRDREMGIRDAMADADVPLKPSRIVRGWFGHDSGDKGMRQLMGSAYPPRAVVCVSDSVAIGALNAARDLGLRVPEDVSLAGIDDVPAAAWPICNLSTIGVPLDKMSMDAANLLIDRLTGVLTGPPVNRVHTIRPVPRGTHA
ncbi:LacI family DNA-binding transcriptional regulator [Arthrobacter sp. H5]|uniref:LacI family DNA-binding transcriptional regulator n=1 Tax=Arthrobacter sp. H5 TaxID=1267973 RepID=UPI0004B8D583|nr:LacI family DNA-binding transcriptional regulator [Arthrobacter sp. H5]